MLANGSGKARAGKNGAARIRQEWRLLFLSAGEVGLAEHIRESGKKSKPGQAVRLVDILADAGEGYGVFDTLHGHSSGCGAQQSPYRSVSTIIMAQRRTHFYHASRNPNILRIYHR